MVPELAPTTAPSWKLSVTRTTPPPPC